MFTVVAITLPDFVDGEANMIVRALGSGAVDRVHLRKPGCEPQQMARLIAGIPAELHPHLSLGDCQNLAVGTDIGGVHLNSRCPAAPSGFTGLISRSCHSIAETAGCDYVFLSPVFESISKRGYRPTWTLDELAGRVDRHVYGLGGVTPERFEELARAGFGGAAMLGYIWQDFSDAKLQNILTHKTICCNL